jgi:hypothetical protein
MVSLPAILLLIAGIVGLLPVDRRIPWALIAVAGALMAF